jgi:Na+/melibiose symporter-like transporter
VTLWLFLHYFGFVLWLGAGVASMLAGLGARREGPAVIAAVTRIQAALQRNVIAPGAGLVIVTGLFLTMKTFGMGNVAPSGWLMTMQVAGLLGAGLTLFVALPTSSRLARISPEGATAPLFEQLRKRMAIAGSLAGSLGWLALIAGAALRGG